jgi:hypothetical protein
MVIEVIAFIVGGVIVAWGFASASLAFGGGQHAGLHEVAPVETERGPSEEQRARRARMRTRVNQALLYGLSLGVLAAFVLMVWGALVA